MKDEIEINEKLSEVLDRKLKFHGMTYEDGVAAALEWVLGGEDPLAD